MFKKFISFVPIIKSFRISIPVVYASSQINEEPTFSISQLTKELQHEFLIKQACTVNINASSQLITVTSIAIQDTCVQIRQCLEEEILLVKQIMEYGEMTAPEEFYDQLIEIRNRLTNLNYSLATLSGYMEHAEKIATAVAELSYISGNIAGSDAICERINQAIRACDQEKDLTNNLKLESLETQKVAITRPSQIENLYSEENGEEDDSVIENENIND